MLLAIDTATYRASVALHDGVTLRGECTWEAVNRHTVTLASRITELLQASDSTPEALSGVAVCIGPGSYTGVRIGIAVAKGLAMTRSLPLVGIPTLDILAAGQPPDPRPLYALFSAGRQRVGYACYRWQETAWEAETEIAVVTWEELAQRITEPTLIVGELTPEGLGCLSALGERVVIPAAAWHLRRAGFLADLGWKRLRANDPSDPHQIIPLYLH